MDISLFLLTGSNIGTLDFGCNNLRSIPPLVGKLRMLTRLSVSKNSIRCTHAHDYSGLPMELSSLSSLEELDVSECNFPHVPPAIWRLPNLKYLNISRNKINMLVPEVGNLIKLKHLNAQLTNISTLPPEIAFCQDLEVLLLFGNVIDSLPETLRELPSLHTMAINYQSFCSIFDAYMDNLLQKGQIQSEHIPPVVFEIPSLRALNLEATKINTLPDKCNARLERFHLHRNFLARVPSIVPNIATLKVLDMSNNFLTCLPEDLGQLWALEELHVDNNRIDTIPQSFGHLISLQHLSMGGNKIAQIPSQLGNLSKLKTLVLERNQIKEIPETIIKLTELETLDLTSNQISALPICFYKMTSLVKAHTYDKLTKAGLWLHRNPITVPPQDIWKTEDPSKIYTYLKKLEIMRTENLQRQKLILLGDGQSGKTSLVHTMISGKSLLTEGISASTKMAEYTTWRTDNDVSFMVLDLGGHSVYKITHPMFLDPTSMYLLVYDHRRYTAQSHYEQLGYWLSLLQVYAPGAIVKIIGTQIDNISEAIGEATLEVVRDKVQKQLEEMNDQIEKELARLDTNLEDAASRKPAEICDVFKKQRAKLEHLKANPLHIYGDIKLTSCEEGIPGVLDLVEELEYLAVDKKLRPRAQRFIPENWRRYRRALKLQEDHCLGWDQVTSLGKKHGIWGNALVECLEFLSETGEVFWFKNIPDLKDTLFHNPRKTVQILGGLFRHDLQGFLNYSENRVFASRGQFTEATFTESKDFLQRCGQVSRPMLQCLWFYLRLDYDNFNLLCELVPKLDLCYLVPQPDIPVRRAEFSQLLVIPSFNVDPHPDDINQDLWTDSPQKDHIELSVTFTFPIHYPQGLFERLACRVQNLVISRIDWQDVIVAEAEPEEDKRAEGPQSTIQLFLKRSLHPEDFSPVFTLTTRGEQLGSASELLKKVCSHVLSLIKDCPGIVWYVNFDTVNCKDATVADCLPTELLSG